MPMCVCFLNFIFIYFFNNLKWGNICAMFYGGINALALLYFAKIGGCMYAG